MDKEYVERDEFIKRLRGEYIAKYPLEFCLGLFAAANELEDAPAADVVEVRHGEWREDTEYYDDDYSECNVRKVFVCSRCGRSERKKEPYCNCGAKMDGERKDEGK